ncbi:MAG: hypothetical protein HYU64_18725 [Armatimonadetes bacterium]|nr:hypothetical protein [Armatimonadota bacterium]
MQPDRKPSHAARKPVQPNAPVRNTNHSGAPFDPVLERLVELESGNGHEAERDYRTLIIHKDGKRDLSEMLKEFSDLKRWFPTKNPEQVREALRFLQDAGSDETLKRLFLECFSLEGLDDAEEAAACVQTILGGGGGAFSPLERLSEFTGLFRRIHPCPHRARQARRAFTAYSNS